MRHILSLLVITTALVGCKNPGADVAPASVEAAPESEAKAAPSKPLASLSIDPSNSKVEFVGAKVTASHPGGFTDFSGKLDLGDPLEQSRIEITIQTASLYADKEKLTKHLKSPDFFDVAQFPTAVFRSTEIKKEGEGHLISGDLTLHGELSCKRRRHGSSGERELRVLDRPKGLRHRLSRHARRSDS